MGGGMMSIFRTPTRAPRAASDRNDESKAPKANRMETERAAPETQRTYLSLVPRFLTSSSTKIAPTLRKKVSFEASSTDELTTSDVGRIKEEQEAWQTMRSTPPRQSRGMTQGQGSSTQAVYAEDGTKIKEEPVTTAETSGTEVTNEPTGLEDMTVEELDRLSREAAGQPAQQQASNEPGPEVGRMTHEDVPVPERAVENPSLQGEASSPRSIQGISLGEELYAAERNEEHDDEDDEFEIPVFRVSEKTLE
jgi:hypothetical protein